MTDYLPRHEGDILTEDDTRLKQPPMYQVILLNDDYTTMEFVVMILEAVFRKAPHDAHRIMLSVHEKGSGIAGVYPKEIAETKIATVHGLAAEHEFPLRCTMEPI